MAASRHTRSFGSSEEGKSVRKNLESMVKDDGYITPAAYSPDTEKYPNNEISFVEKHMIYLGSHPKVEIASYMSNLRLMTRRR